jgi:type I restriction enzyme S subunit
MEAREPDAHYVEALHPTLVRQFDLLATATGGVSRLRELILTLAVRGKLVPQHKGDEPAAFLMEKIRACVVQPEASNAVRQGKDLPPIEGNDEPFPVPTSWVWVPLGNVVEIIRGITFPASEKTREPAPGRIACLRTANVQASIEWDDLLFVARSFMGREEQVIRRNDIVMSMANSRELVGKVAIVENVPHSEATFGGFLGVLRPRQIEPSYVMALLRTPYARAALIDSASQTTNIANVSLAKLRPLPFPLPPLAEQARIVARVDELMRLCDALEAKGRLEAEQHARLLSTLLGTLTDSTTPEELAANWQRVADHFDLLLDHPEAVNALEQTVLQLAVRGLLVPQDPNDEPAHVLLQTVRAEKDQLQAQGKLKKSTPLPVIDDGEVAFELPRGWCWSRLGDLTLQVTDGTHHTPRYQANGVAFISVKDIDGKTVSFDDCKFISEQEHRQINSRCNPERGDILLCRIGTLGRPTVVDTDRPFSLFVSVGLLKLPKQIDLTSYLHAVLSSPLLAKQFEDIKAGGSHTNKLNLGDIPKLMIPLPPLAEQQRILIRLEQLRGLCAALRQRLAAAQTTQSHLAEALVDSAAV